MSGEKTTRLAWLDAMRGFTMILVVAYHVAQFGFCQDEKSSASLPFLVLFRMPLFFFVSGFLAHKARYEWTAGNALRMTWKKLKVQVVPALVFLAVFIVFKEKGAFRDNFLAAMRLPTKGGYWFTWVLLQMFALYYLCCVAGHYLGKWREWGPAATAAAWAALWLASVACYETLYMPKTFTYHRAPFFDYSSLVETIRFMQFFLLGNIARRYWDRVERIFDTPWFYPLVVCAALVSCADIFRWHTMRLTWTNLPRTAAMYALLTITLMFFRHYQEWFTGGRVAGRALQFIGQRTLDIYLLHFILLPKLPELGQWLEARHPNFVLDITLSMGVALLVIAFCLLISQLLRVSPFLRLYLFGRR